ncbi:hypothetical protein WM31_00950 [Burkholderia ubonensis]|nr:hypothetical protein WM31_00950 [Burkholderia ubonensis]
MGDSIILDIQHRPVVCECLLSPLQYLQFEPFDVHFHEVYVSSASHVVKSDAWHLNTSRHRFCLDRHATKVAWLQIIWTPEPNRTGLRCTGERPRRHIVHCVQREIRAQVLEHKWLRFERDYVSAHCLGRFCQRYGLTADVGTDFNDCTWTVDPLLQELRFEFTVLTVFN